MTDSPTRGVFDVAVTDDDGVCVVVVDGEVDMMSARRLGDVAFEAASSADGGLVVDLAGVTFLSSSGITVLLRTLGHLPSGAAAAFVAPQPAARRPITLSGLDREATSWPDRATAVEAVRSADPVQ
ncbi:STAS domain-containing protein [Rhodococcoides corynebacterioides]|uniref:STAS domain-containing protein n=1 Tax=Rhodococcoides corynebacterioides TaxID=53972 RepID=UPI001C9B9469|nr:STAS domain-containing protein [Rhodococcus corynebacterioides]MBY6348918.1 STAS domain-containing protein [Rhodococcus corynebacterioides]